MLYTFKASLTPESVMTNTRDSLLKGCTFSMSRHDWLHYLAPYHSEMTYNCLRYVGHCAMVLSSPSPPPPPPPPPPRHSSDSTSAPVVVAALSAATDMSILYKVKALGQYRISQGLLLP
jgi:hypothetical protein